MAAKSISSKTLLLLAASGLALAGCKIDNRPLLARGGPPPAAALPEPGPIEPETAPYYAQTGQPIYPASGPVAPARAYPYAERAYALDRAFYDVPPDYGFYYGDEEPWVWETADDYYMFAEPYGDDYAFYYYEPGYDYPYFVRDANYGYAFGPDGALIALFSAAGALLSLDDYNRYYPEAHRYWTRGYDMYQDFGRSPHAPVNQAVWTQRAPRIVQAQQSWISAPATQPAWRAWRSSDQGRAVAQRADAVGRVRAPRAAQDQRFAAFNGRQAQGAMAQPPQRFARNQAMAQPQRFGRNQAMQQRFARNESLQRPRGAAGAQRAFAPSVQEHGRFAAARAPERMAERGHGPQAHFQAQARAQFHAQAAPHAFQPRGGGGPHFAEQAAPHQFQPHGGGGPHFAQAAPHAFQPHGGGGGGGPHFAQAAPAQVFHGGGGGHGGGGAPHPQAAPQPHGGGGGGGQAHGGGGQPHGGGANNGHKHGG